MAVDPCAVYINPRIELGKLLHSGHLIGQRVVAHVAVISVVKFLAAPRRTHAVNLHNDEPQVRRAPARRRAPLRNCASHASRLRTGIDVIDDRVFLIRIEIRGLEHEAVKIRDAVTRFHGEHLRRLPADSEQL